MVKAGKCVVALAVSALMDAVAFAKQVEPSFDEKSIETIYVYGEPNKTASATKLNLSTVETPQMVTVISRDQIEDFSLRQINSLLNYVPGVTVEQVETGRTYYTARGFDIVNFQFDGVGVPLSYGLSQGHEDSAIYQQVEVIKGATGLITGLANPSATINYVRKRPTDETQVFAAASMGSWGQFRFDGDFSGPVFKDTINGRVVVAKEKGDTYVDRYHKDRDVFYGVLSGYLAASTQFTVGHSINDSRSAANSSGALPLFYTDGSLTDYDVSTNTAPHWATQEVEQQRTFIELEQALGDFWLAKAIYTHNNQDKAWKSLYLSGFPDADSEEGLLAQASLYQANDKEDIFDFFVSGTFSVWGQEHDIVIGANYAEIDLDARSVYSSEWDYAPIGGDWAQGNIAEPVFDIFDPGSQTTDIHQKQNSFYVSARLKFTDNIALLLGARNVNIEQDGISYGAPQAVSDDETVPYLGLTYEIFNGTMLYGSYSEVFKAQTWVDADLTPLGAARGDSDEVGIKQALFSGHATVTLALFQSSQDNFGEWESRDPASGLNVYRGVSFDSEGFEVEIIGEVLPGLNITAGYTQVEVEDENGHKTRRFIPQHQFKLATAYSIPSISGLRIGAGINWQSEIYYGDVEVQDAYAVLDLFAGYRFGNNVNVAFNINNVGNTKYRLSPEWGQANLGAPRNVMASVSWRY